jgi:phenylpyruvate tautomerase PptA (4-oxalocrotonate tautomerase family)
MQKSQRKKAVAEAVTQVVARAFACSVALAA